MDILPLFGSCFLLKNYVSIPSSIHIMICQKLVSSPFMKHRNTSKMDVLLCGSIFNPLLATIKRICFFLKIFSFSDIDVLFYWRYSLYSCGAAIIHWRDIPFGTTWTLMMETLMLQLYIEEIFHLVTTTMMMTTLAMDDNVIVYLPKIPTW